MAKKEFERDCLVYDIEIERCIPSADPDEDAISPYAFCEGWQDYKGMGIACIVAYDFGDQLYRLFLAKDNLDEFVALAARREYIVGYNSKSFDDQVCKANGIKIETTYDLYEEIKLAAGAKKHTRGYKLNDVAHINMFPNKEMEGDQAPILFQQKKFGSLLDYCLRDVQLTKMLLEQGISSAITDPINRGPLTLRSLFSAKNGGDQAKFGF